jgi:hypothetical protein
MDQWWLLTWKKQVRTQSAISISKAKSLALDVEDSLERLSSLIPQHLKFIPLVFMKFMHNP